MEEKRHYKRTDLNTKVSLQILGENGQDPHHIEAELTDISTDGIGFKSNHALMIGVILKGRISLWTKETVDVILKVVRASQNETDMSFTYGCIFVGLQENESLRIKIYQMFDEKGKNR